MGHIGRLKDEYRALSRRLEAGQVAFPEPRGERAWEGWREILEILFTPEEAAVAAQLPTRPARIEKIATRVGASAEELRPRLETMCDHGLVVDLVDPRSGEVRYALAPPVVGFIEFSMMRRADHIPKKRMAEALEAYFQGDEVFAREVFGGETVIGRTLAHESVMGDDLPDVLDWERASALVEQATARSVSLCYCRHTAEHLGTACDAPAELCMSLNGGAEFVVRRGFGRAIDVAEAKDLLAQGRQLGLVRIADNVMSQPTYVCNCCGCCCEQLRSISRYGLPAVNPSGFVPEFDRGHCKGCSRCARACPIAAITMHATRAAAQRKSDLEPELDAERCIGCGLCVDACRNGAMRLTRRAERPYVPESMLERVVRMAIERGHLADLVFDEGESRGALFLNRIFRALTALPPVQTMLASEQLKSRFVRGMVSRVKAPGLQPHP